MPVGPKVNASRAQGSLEYLLILGVVILITAVVIGVLTGVITFGRIEASQEQADSVYTGLQDVMDLSKGRTILNIKLKAGENVIEINDAVRKTIWTIFGNLPENTQIIFQGADCSKVTEINSDNISIDANKKQSGNAYAYFQNDNSTKIVNQCIVPTDTTITINVPEETEVNVPVEKEGEIVQEITSGEDLNKAIWENPSGNYKLQPLPTEYYLDQPLPKFSGILEGNGNSIGPSPNYEKDYYFEELDKVEIKNLTLRNPSTDPEVTSEYYLANTCANQDQRFISLISPDQFSGYKGPCKN